MTPEYGAASQLDKIDMLDFADLVAINKFDRRGAEDALRDVSKQYQRNHQLFSVAPDTMPVLGTIASRFNDDGVTALYQSIVEALEPKGLKLKNGRLDKVSLRSSSKVSSVVPPERARCLADISSSVREYKKHAVEQAYIARERQQLLAAKAMLSAECGEEVGNLNVLAEARDSKLDPGAKKLLAMWPDMQKAYAGDEYVVKIRDKEIRTKLTYKS